MPSTAQSIVTQAFFDMQATAANETPSTDELNDGLIRLNQLVSSVSTEGLIVPNQVMQSFNLQAGIAAYTLGPSGTLPTTGGLRAMKVTSWRSVYGLMARGGPPVSLADFGAAATRENERIAAIALAAALEGQIAGYPTAISSPTPRVVGTDTAFPNINIRIFPAPSALAGPLELGYWTPIAAFAGLATVVNLPDGWERMLHFNLAVDLYPQYARQGGIPPELAAEAQNSKAVLMGQNDMTRPAPPQQQQQQQQQQ